MLNCFFIITKRGIELVNLIIIWAGVLLASLALLIKSSDYLIDGISDYARKLGLSNYIIGLLVVSIAASAPEFIAAMTGGGLGSSEVAFGVLVGTNIAHIFFVFGTLAIFGKKMNIECKILEKSKLLLFLFALAPFLLLIDGRLGRIDGIILVGLFFVYFGMLWRQEGKLGMIKKRIKLKRVWKDALLFLLALIALFLSARWLVLSSMKLGTLIGISALFMSLTVIALGDALSDLIVSVRATMKKEENIGVGDILGSTMTNFLLGLGIVSIVYPIQLNFMSVLSVIIFAVAGTGALLLYIRRGFIGWKSGVMFILGYVLFVVVQAMRI